MKAFTRQQYGGPEILELKEATKPEAQKGQLLIKVHANSANPADWHMLRGTPKFARLVFGLFKPRQEVLGVDFAGVVETVGPGVSDFKPGDRVFGESIKGGAFAEYISVPANVCAKIPVTLSFENMACLPVAGLTALQGLSTYGKLTKGESVLVNGASGGVGHFTVQIAKAFGARVTGVCSNRNKDFVQKLGADQVIAYDKESIHLHEKKYDLVIDTHGNLSFQDFKRMGKRGVLIGFTTFSQMIKVSLKALLNRYPLVSFTAKANKEDLEILAKLSDQEQLTPHLDKSYHYTQIPEAISYIEQMRTRGKVAMVWNEES